MDPVTMQKLAYSAVVILIIHLLFYLLKRYARRTQVQFGIRKSRYFAIKRLLTAMSIVLTLVAVFFLWNINLKHAWASLTGILALVAIAFFAVWSLVGNILAGFIIYFTSPFKVDDAVEILPDGIRGTVLAVNTFYTVLMDEDSNYINIPNSLLFQKYIRVIKTTKHTPQPEG